MPKGSPRKGLDFHDEPIGGFDRAPRTRDQADKPVVVDESADQKAVETVQRAIDSVRSDIYSD